MPDHTLPIRYPLAGGRLLRLTPEVATMTRSPETAQVTVAELYQAHRLAMVRVALLLVDDLATAEDVVQDAYSKLHARWRGLRDPHAALAYLRVAVVNGSR